MPWLIKDSEVKKSLSWHILRLLRSSSRTKQELKDKLNDIYLGHWQVNDGLVNANLDRLCEEHLIKYSDSKYEIAEGGVQLLSDKDRDIERNLAKSLSKDACAAYSLFGKVGLSCLEFVVGYLSGSVGLVADAMHTAIDIGASAITWAGIKTDREAQAALSGGLILIGVGLFIAFESATKILEPAQIQFQTAAIIAIIISILVNGFFSYYKFYVGGRTRSISLIADAYHTKTDIWSSVAVFVGILGSSAGIVVLDALAGISVSLFIILGGLELISESRKVMKGEDPRMEKFSKFLDGHLKALQDRAIFVSLWFFNLQGMTEEEYMRCIEKGFGRRYPISLEEKDYKTIYNNLRRDDLIEPSKGGRFELTDKGRMKLMELAERPAAYMAWPRRRFLNPRQIHWYTEGL
jgi:cation diffusion facilitator family transporter